MKQFANGILAAALVLVPAGIVAQANRPAPSVTEKNSDSKSLMAGSLTKTVHEVWVESGRNEEKFFDVVKAMADMSADKRGLELPNTEAAGRELGERIKASARRDPDQLLFSVVDAAVRQTSGAKPRAAVTK